ncbi:flavin monoamine oxidase family protein [Ectopseudomonas khazarica]|uniref:flavin monoamine oxidase family protein n=1 Tax=Ectopseudomonas khazarica TaxID=2502979 RepID=UPI002FE052AF
MQTARIAIVGAGLSGLYAAYLLEQRGIRDYVLLEAREVLGGRILSVAAQGNMVAGTSGVDRFDLGPSWFWPGYQRQLDRLVHDLGLERFEQFEDGDMVVERSPYEPPIRSRGYFNSPPSMRLLGGMAALIDALRERLDATRILTGHAVSRLRHMGKCVELDSIDSSDRSTTWRVEHVLLAMPPRLVEETIEFIPALPPTLARQWQATATWMAPHAKYFAIYERPFWREQGLSGEARSARGPMGEIHDASIPDGSAALFGFLGVPARVRQDLAEEQLRSLCRAQLERMFGPQAAKPKAEFLQDWAQERYTATLADRNAGGQHTMAPKASPETGPWFGCLTGIGSEWSPQFPGYVAGAIEAASLGVQALSAFAEQAD